MSEEVSTPEQVQEKVSVRKVITNRDFSKIWLSQLVNNIGTFMSFLAFPLYAYFLTGNELWLGIISLVELVPTLLFSPVAGMVVDSFSRKKIMILSNLLSAMFVFIIPVIMSFSNVYSHELLMAVICVVIFVNSILQRFFMPAESASIPKLVERDEIGVAVSISQTTQQVIVVLGPILAIAIITTFGYNLVFLIDSMTFLFSSCMILFIKKDLSPDKESNLADFEKPSVLLGTKKLLFTPSLRYIAVTLFFIMSGTSMVNAFLVAYAKGELHLTDNEFGLAVSLVGLSGVVGGLFLTTKMSKISNPLSFVSNGILLNGFVWTIAAFIHEASFFYILAILGGLVNILINIPATTVFMKETSDHIRGQVFSSLNLVISCSSLIGILFGTFFIASLGVRNLYLLSGLIQLTVAVLGFFYLFFIFENSLVEKINSEPLVS